MTHYVLPDTTARLDFDKRTRALYVAVASKLKAAADGGEGVVAKTVTVNHSPMVNLDYDENGKLVGVEILL